MDLVITGFVSFIAIQHLGFLVLEMFLWCKPVGMKIFRNTAEKAELTKILAANQGLYNGFLVAGLIWSLLTPNVVFANQLQLFFLSCVLVAGIYGGYSVNRRIFFVQGIPAMITLGMVLVS